MFDCLKQYCNKSLSYCFSFINYNFNFYFLNLLISHLGGFVPSPTATISSEQGVHTPHVKGQNDFTTLLSQRPLNKTQVVGLEKSRQLGTVKLDNGWY